MVWRPRSEWIISEKPTHSALITREQAERILSAVETNHPKPLRRDLRRPDQYLLTGLLLTPDGQHWQGDGRFYRAGSRGKRILREAVDLDVLRQITREVRGKEFLAKLVEAAREMADSIEDNPVALDGALRSTEAKIKRVADAVADSGLGSLANKLRELEGERDRLRQERALVAERAKLKRTLRSLRSADVVAMVEFSGAPVEGQDIDVPAMRHVLGALVERVERDPQSRRLRAHYRFRISGAKLASPRGFEPRLPP